MTLKEYFQSLDAVAREDFAKRCETTVDYLVQLCYGNRRPKVELAVRIARESDNKVTCEELLPAVDWEFLRNGNSEAAA